MGACPGADGTYFPASELCNWDVAICTTATWVGLGNVITPICNGTWDVDPYNGYCDLNVLQNMYITSPSEIEEQYCVWYWDHTNATCSADGEPWPCCTGENEGHCTTSETACSVCNGEWIVQTPMVELGINCFTFPDPAGRGNCEDSTCTNKSECEDPNICNSIWTPSPCGYLGSGEASVDYPPVFIHGDSEHTPPSIVNYIAFTHPTQQHINNVFPSSWLDVPGTGQGEFTNQDVIYTDFWDWSGTYNHHDRDFSYYQDGEWTPNIVLNPARGYVLKTRQDGWIKWRLNG
jgi:hypothetical protein